MQVINWITAILRWIQVIYFGLGRHVDQIPRAKVVEYLKVFSYYISILPYYDVL